MSGAARGTQPAALAAAVKALVVSAKPSAEKAALHAQCVLLGREAREAVVAMANGPLDDAQTRRIDVAANELARLALAAL